MTTVTDEVETPDTLLDEAWRILCNVSEGDWTKQTDEWQQATDRFRDKYHVDLDERRATEREAQSALPETD